MEEENNIIIEQGVVLLDAPMEDAETYNFTQAYRKALVTTLTRKGIPTDEIRGNLLLSTLDSMDKQINSRNKLRLEEAKVKSDDELKALMAGLLMSTNQSDHQTLGTAKLSTDYTPELPSEISNIELVPGQTEVNPGQIEFDAIMSAER